MMIVDNSRLLNWILKSLLAQQECRHAVVVRVIVAVAGGGEVRALPCREWWCAGRTRLSGTQSIHSLPLHTVTVTTPPLLLTSSHKPVPLLSSHAAAMLGVVSGPVAGFMTLDPTNLRPCHHRSPSQASACFQAGR